MTEELHILEGELKELETKIHKTAELHRNEAKAYGDAKAKFEIAQANALLNIFSFETETGEKNTESVRKAKALKRCESEYMDYRIAEANADSSREVLRAFLAQLTSVQTRCGLLKAEASLVAGNYK